VIALLSRLWARRSRQWQNRSQADPRPDNYDRTSESDLEEEIARVRDLDLSSQVE
jgi:hypothetical protein